MNNIKLRGKAVRVSQAMARGFKYVRKPKRSAMEVQGIHQMDRRALKKRSKNRRRRELATTSKRRNRK